MRSNYCSVGTQNKFSFALIVNKTDMNSVFCFSNNLDNKLIMNFTGTTTFQIIKQFSEVDMIIR